MQTKYSLIIIKFYTKHGNITEIKKIYIIVNKEKEGGYSGQCLELPGVISQGGTLEELKTNMADAINLVLEYIQDRAKKEKGKIIEIAT